MAEYEADVVIVGAGVAGLLAAWNLVRTGARVLVLESGPRVNRAEAVETYRNAVIKTPESPYPDVPYAPRPAIAAMDDYYVQVGPVAFKSNYERRVGGTTWHWLGTTLRHIPSDFEMQSRYGVAADWPFGYDAIEPWYLAAEQALGVAGDNDEDYGSTRSGNYPLPPLPLTYLDRRIALAVAPLGLEVKLTPQARNSIAYDGRPPCCGNATCVMRPRPRRSVRRYWTRRSHTRWKLAVMDWWQASALSGPTAANTGRLGGAISLLATRLKHPNCC